MDESLVNKKFEIAIYDLDMNFSSTLPVICNYFYDVGIEHGPIVFKDTEIMNENVVFVVTRFQIRIDRYPALRENVTVRSWISPIEQKHAVRNYLLLDDSENILAKAICSIAAFDLKKRAGVDISVSKEISCTEELSIDTGNIEQSPENEQQIFVSSCDPHCTSTAHSPSQEESAETVELLNDYKPMNASFRRNCYQFKPVTSSELFNKNASGADDCGNEYEEFQPPYTNDTRSGKFNGSMLSAYEVPLYQLYDFEWVS
jgi:acyl-CoA thioesterase FadM